MKPTISAVLGVVLLAGSAMAGPAPVMKAPVTKAPVIEEKAPVIQEPVCTVPFTGIATIGYDTDFVYRGFNLGQDNIHAGIDLNIPIRRGLSADIGAHYNNPTDSRNGLGGPYDQLDVYGNVNFPLWFLQASFGVIWHGQPTLNNSSFFGNDTQTFDFFLGLSADLRFFTLNALLVRDVDVMKGWYFELGASRTFALGDCLDLNVGGGVSLVADYGEFSNVGFELDGFHHAYLSAGLTYYLTSNAALNAYLALNYLLGDSEDVLTFQDDVELYGGMSLSVSF